MITQQKPQGQDKVIADIQIYDTSKKSAPPNPLFAKQDNMFPFPVAQTAQLNPTMMNSYLRTINQNMQAPFIYKDYNIQIGGPNADHIQASMIYEDALPPAEIYSSYKSLKERNALCDYVRSSFIKNDEGELVDFTGGNNSLNSRLKILEMNPYNINHYTSNPYVGLPKGMLIYKSCYPIVYDKKLFNIQCNKNSVGMNIRVYQLSLEELIAKYYDNNVILGKNVQYLSTLFKDIDTNSVNLTKYNIWREVFYYEYIRNEINRQFISPNFVESYCYFVDKTSNIKFQHNMNDDRIINKDTYSKTNLIILTESPNYNMYSWACSVYTTDRNLKKQIYNGYKSDDIWSSVIAQMLIVFYVMNKFKFTYDFMDIESSFFIKDLNVYGDNKQYWKYLINGVNYYIPNKGHLLMMDHNYRDITTSGNKYKILASKFGDDVNTINSKILNHMKNCLNSNNFGEKFKNDGGVAPSSNILDMLNNINKDLNNTDNLAHDKLINNVIFNHLRSFVNNRVGTVLRDLEIPYINENSYKPFKSGDIVVWEERYNTYKFVMFIDNIDEHSCSCLTRDIKNNIVSQKLPRDNLYHYSEYETIKQDTDFGEKNPNVDNVIESYAI